MERDTVLEVAQELDHLVRARYPFIAIQTYEEQRVVEVVKRIAFGRDKAFFLWNCNRGLMEISESGTVSQSADKKNMKSPQKVLEFVDRFENEAIFVLQDFQMFIGKNPAVDRQVKDVVTALRASRKNIVITGTFIQVPNDLDKFVTMVDFPMPDKEVLSDSLDAMVREITLKKRTIAIDLENGEREMVIEASRGLTVEESKHVWAKVVVAKGKLDKDAVKIITQEKRQAIRKSGILEFFPADSQMDEIGGLDLLKRYISDREGWWADDVREFGLRYPKGIVLIGIPGCGKSLSAKTMASYWNLPLIRLDMGRVFDRYVGGSEENIRKAMTTAEAVAPCCLWIDEVEKAMAVGSGDNGTSRRVFGQFLTWMQEKEEAVFVVCTANKVTGDGALPPEFLRKGRFDELFFVDLPTKNELIEILKIHLGKKNRTLSEEELGEIADTCAGYSGAEIEAAVENALWKVFRNKGKVTKEILIESVKETKPLSDTMKQELEEIREWAKGRVRYASSEKHEEIRAGASQELNIEVDDE